MSEKQLGRTAPQKSTKEVSVKDRKLPGHDWVVSDDAMDKIQKLEDNIRTSEKQIGSILLK